MILIVYVLFLTDFTVILVENTIQSLQTKLARDLRDADNDLHQIKLMIPPNVLKMTLKELKGYSTFDEIALTGNKSNVNSTIAEIIAKADEGNFSLQTCLLSSSTLSHPHHIFLYRFLI